MGGGYVGKTAMLGYAALCDLQGIISKVIYGVPADLFCEGQDIREMFADQEACSSLFSERTVKAGPVRLRLAREPGREVCAAVKRVEDSIFFVLFDKEEPETAELVFALLDEMEAKDRKAYEDGLCEVQKVNNQLINSQRELARANERLKSLLKETRKAKSTIEILERDPLTALYQFNAFLERGEAMLTQFAETEFDLITVDVERFKIVNDAFGTEEGDRLLLELSTCLLSARVEEKSLFARAEADKLFALVPRDRNQCEKLRRNLDILEANYPLPMRIRIKMGVYQIDDREISMARMCDRAVLACSSIKGIYDRNLAFYDDSIRKRLLMEQKLLDTMVDSLERYDFKVYLQPKVDIVTGGVIGAEALVRWIHPEIGFISPADFIPVFEKNRFIYSLDLYVWKNVCGMCREWREKWGRSIPVSVNVSRIDIHQADLPEVLTELVRSHGLEPKDLHLEITESAYVTDTRQMLAVIRRLKEIGFVIEMDDFGKGYSSLHTLSELPIDVLKMDLGFLHSGDNPVRRQLIMQFVMNMARELKLQVIAEGVETEEQVELLKSMGCEYAQGYYYGRPMPQEEFLKYMDRFE